MQEHERGWARREGYVERLHWLNPEENHVEIDYYESDEDEDVVPERIHNNNKMIGGIVYVTNKVV